MKPDILTKLKDELRQPITSERQVVYILAEIRKLLELEAIERQQNGEQPSNKFFALRFYCHWAVHVRLDQAGAQRIVERFNAYQALNEQLRTGQPLPDLAFLSELDQSLQLAKFRSELQDYLTSHQLDNSVATDNTRWLQFLTHYSQVIEDAPLVSEAHGLEWVNTVTLKVLDTKPPGMAEHVLTLCWSWVCKKTGVKSNIVRHFAA